MIIYLTRHGQTRYNIHHQMQGRTDEPLNETGKEQARAMREKLMSAHPDLRFDAVYASPLDRAAETASVIGGVPRSEIITDERIIEADFGPYELMSFWRMGPRMIAYWALPEIFPAPDGVESVGSLVARSRSFLSELEKKPYGTVLVACHGGILRALCGYMEERKNGILWRPKPKNCEIRVYESGGGTRRRIETFRL